MRFKFTKRFDFPQLTAETYDDGVRIYSTPLGPAPSVTTILSTLPHEWLDEWVKSVGGQEEADKISKEATDIGSAMHEYLETYLGNYLRGLPDKPPTNEIERTAYSMSKIIRLSGFKDLTEIFGIEEALHCENLYAGRSDLIGVYKGVPSIIDYKSSKRYRDENMLYNYKLQLAAYAIAVETMFGERINQGVLLIAIRPNFGSGAQLQRVIINGKEFDQKKDEWMGIVEDFYK